MFEPARDDTDDVPLLIDCQSATPFDAVPLGEASTTARGRGVLGREHRVTAPRCLPAIVRRIGRRESVRHEILGMQQHRRQAATMKVVPVLGRECLAPPEFAAAERREQVVEIAHAERIAPARAAIVGRRLGRS